MGSVTNSNLITPKRISGSPPCLAGETWSLPDERRFVGL